MRPFVDHVPLYEDDRGSVYCVVDNDVDNVGDGAPIKRTYVVRNWSKGLIRAWHGHAKAWTGIHVIKGAAKIAAKNMGDCEDIVIQVLSDRKPGIFWIPPGWYNGAMSLEDDTRLLVYSTLSFDEVKSDDYRLPLADEDRRDVFKVVDR